MKKVEFSIIVPIYNIELYLEQCIESIINQTIKNFEIILVDDGSSDSSPEICERYKAIDNRIKVIHKKNGGLVSARQAGVSIAEGEYILCVDGDDWISNNYVESFKNIINKFNPDIICCGFVQVYTDHEKLYYLREKHGYYNREKIEKEIFPSLISGKNGVGFEPTVWAKAFRKKIYKTQQLSINPKIKIGEDGACTIPCIFNASSLYIMQECNYYYRFNANSMTKEKKSFSWEGIEEIYNHLINQLDINEYNFREQLYWRMIHSIFNVAVSQFYTGYSYKNICKNISDKIDNGIFKDIIKNCKVKDSLKLSIVLFTLKHKIYWPLKIYSLLK